VATLDDARSTGYASMISLVVACASPQSPPQASPTTPATSGAAAAAELPPGSTQPVRSDEMEAAPIEQAPFGQYEGKEVQLYTLTNAHGLALKVMTYGAIVTELHVPDKTGKLADVVLGFEDLRGYLEGSPYFGAMVGRVANRIRGAKFKLHGKEYELAANDPPHHLHGGTKGWDKAVWSARARESPDGPGVELTYVSKDGEEGYPGTVTATVTYTLTNADEFRIDMRATTDKSTVVNLAHHTYWNLGGHDSGPITAHELTLFAGQYTPGDPVVPTGVIKTVKGTAFDFTTAKPVGKDLQAAGGKPVGFDHNWVVDGDPHALRPVARLKEPKSGRVLTLEADQPGVQFYSGNFLDGTLTGKGASYPQYAGLCLETQKFPNSINVPAWASEVILEPGQVYTHTMIHRFTTE
jgi:aldose 1-epimerase